MPNLRLGLRLALRPILRLAWLPPFAFSALLLRPVAAQTAADGPTLVAPADCWGHRDQALPLALARCAKMGVEVVTLTAGADAAGGLLACAAPGACAPLGGLLVLRPAPRLLLRTPVALLDEVRQAVLQAVRPGEAASRTLIEPSFERPVGDASRSLGPGAEYRREQRRLPRPMMVHIVTLDLARTGRGFVVTPGRPDAGMEFVAEKTSAFARRMGTLVAVNATYFRPFEGGSLLARPYLPAAGQAVEVDGLSIADGHEDSPWASPDPRTDGAFCVTPDAVSIVRDRCPPGTRQAVGAGPVLIFEGESVDLAAQPGARSRSLAEGKASITVDELPAYYRNPQPRTAIGLDESGTRIWWVVVDGRQSGYSEGMTLPELSALFTELGAHSAINLDGGGSSTLVLQGAEGVAAPANSPIHTGIPGRERPVGNHLGLRLAAPPGR